MTVHAATAAQRNERLSLSHERQNRTAGTSTQRVGVWAYRAAPTRVVR